jgi:poly(A) polymerase
VSEVLEIARRTLVGVSAWVVGGAPRDRLLGRETEDLDLVVEGDVAAAARALGRAGAATAFELSGEFGAWRVVGRGHAWQIDLSPLRGGTLASDLARRDFTVNAIAEPLAGGEIIDPLGGARDLRERRLRLAGPRALIEDPLRALRLVRLAVELDLTPEPAALAAARYSAPALARVAGERVLVELRRVLAADDVVAGVRMIEELGLADVVLPELEATRGVKQNRFHHRDVHGHTIEVLQATVDLQRDPAAALGAEQAGAVRALLAEPLADELTRGTALRLGALCHDLAKPLTRAALPGGRVSFLGHDVEGAGLARQMLTRLRASERLRGHVAALTLHHLRLGFLVHERPLSRAAAFDYLRACGPVAADVTLLSVADRLATRGDRAQEAIARHLALARELLPDALRWHAEGPPVPLVAGDVLARELGVAPGPELGRLLEGIARAQFAGTVRTRGQALDHARGQMAQRRSSPA